ncbi:MAG: hypothetical protein AAF502_09725 [Bacteroidota bacterium]
MHELINVWKAYDQKLDKYLKVNERLLREVSFGKVRSLLREFKFTQIFELVCNALFTIFLMGYLIDNYAVLKFLLPGLGLLALMVWGMYWNITALDMMARTDVDTPVIVAQQRIEKLKMRERIERNALLVIIPVFWIAFMIVFFKGVLNLDFYVIFKGLIWSSFAGSIIVATIIVWFLKKFPDKKMEQAIEFLDEIKAIESNT